MININSTKTCNCKPTHLSCIDPKDWLKCQLGVWEFKYEDRDIRKKDIHPATFPISMAHRIISLFSHQGELILDPFVGSGTTLVAANDLSRNAVGFDLNEKYINLCRDRLSQINIDSAIINGCEQLSICDDARNINEYLEEGTVKCVFTSPPYANLLNRKRTNRSRRGDLRKNEQYGVIEQYSQDPRDLGILNAVDFEQAIFDIFSRIRPLIILKGHCIINISDIWIDDTRIPLHIHVIKALEQAGFEFRNTIIWDRRNIVNNIGIFGYPSNYITMGTTFEYLLVFRNSMKKKG